MIESGMNLMLLALAIGVQSGAVLLRQGRQDWEVGWRERTESSLGLVKFEMSKDYQLGNIKKAVGYASLGAQRCLDSWFRIHQLEDVIYIQGNRWHDPRRDERGKGKKRP